MLRRLVINTLYDWAKIITYIADSLAPARDEPWRQRQYQQYIMAHNCQESHSATRTPTE